MSAEGSEPWFIVRLPNDASRVVPLPCGARVQLQATLPFVANWQQWTITSQEQSPGEWRANIVLDEVRSPQACVIAWSKMDGSSIGSTTLLLLPDAGNTQVIGEASLPLGEAHGVLANRRGSSVQARAAWGSIASKYDAFLAANLDPAGPGDRRTVVPWIDLALMIGIERVPVDGSMVASFQAEPTALLWRFDVRGIQLSATLSLGEGNAIALHCATPATVADDVCVLVRPMIDDRSFHVVTKAFEGPEHDFPARVSAASKGFRFKFHGDHELHVQGDAEFRSSPQWRYCVALPVCAARGLETQTDVFSPGEFVWHPRTTSTFALTASVDGDAPPVARASNVMPQLLPQAMRQSLDLYLAHRGGELTVIAGFPWFLDWGRDSLIFTRGLIAEGRLTEAGSVLRRFASFEENGSLPNLLRGSEVTNRETSDAPLWLIVAAGEWIAKGGDASADCQGRKLGDVLRAIVASCKTGTASGVRMDADSGLLFSPSHHTWMDTDGPPGTPRTGYPIEIQALWQQALNVVATLGDATASALADKVRASIERLFWREQEGFFSDCLHTKDGVPAADAVQDDHLRPNQWLAIALGGMTSMEKVRRALQVSQCLLVPGGARSLAPRHVKHLLRVEGSDGLLNDPGYPYWPRYTGFEDRTRKPAYHNGTAWGWQYPLYAECLAKLGGDRGQSDARKLMAASATLWQHGCIGQLPEIMDGDLPHCQRGCGAQAWSISEWVRVWRQIES